MAQSELVKPLLEASVELLAWLYEAEIPVSLMFWERDPDDDRFNLIVSTTEVDEGKRTNLYGRIRAGFRAKNDADMEWTEEIFDCITLLGTRSPVLDRIRHDLGARSSDEIPRTKTKLAPGSLLIVTSTPLAMPEPTPAAA